MFVEVTDLSQQLATRYGVPWAFMTERISTLVPALPSVPCMYSVHTGRLTPIGAAAIRYQISKSKADGTFDRQLTAWTAQ